MKICIHNCNDFFFYSSHHCVIALLGYVDELVLVYLLLARVLGFCHHRGQEAATPGSGGRAEQAGPGDGGQAEDQEAQEAAHTQHQAGAQRPEEDEVSIRDTR